MAELARRSKRSVNNFFQRQMKFVAARIPQDQALRLVRIILEGQGFGAGASISNSGENAVFKLVRNAQPVLVDVGANKGEYTAAFLTHHPSGRAILVEPSSINVAALKKRFEDDRRVTILPCAVDEKPGQARLYTDTPGSGLASLTQRRLDHHGISMLPDEIIEVRTLDDVLCDIGRIDLLKLDVEGHELAALKGANTLISKRQIEMIQFEFGGTNLDTRTNLGDFFYALPDFRISVIAPRGIIPLPRYDEILEQYSTTNFLATRLRRAEEDV